MDGETVVQPVQQTDHLPMQQAQLLWKCVVGLCSYKASGPLSLI